MLRCHCLNVLSHNIKLVSIIMLHFHCDLINMVAFCINNIPITNNVAELIRTGNSDTEEILKDCFVHTPKK